MTALYLACDSADVDEVTGECSAPIWAEGPTLFPPLTTTEGLQIGFAIVGVWTIGLIARVLVRTAQEGQRH